MPSSIAWSVSRMDGRDELRRYLQQRKESGERELVLDQLVGVRPGTRQPAVPSASLTPPSTRGAEHASADWRDVLRTAGASPAGGTAPALPTAHLPPPTGLSVGGSDRELFSGPMGALDS